MKYLISAVVSMLLLTGCASQPGYQPELSFEAKTISGESFAGSTLNGQDTLIWFWTPWCAICARESQDIAALQKQYPDINILGIAGYGTAEEMIGFTERTGTENIVHLNDSTGQLWAGFEVPIQPSVVIIDELGNATLKIGPSSRLELEELLDDLNRD